MKLYLAVTLSIFISIFSFTSTFAQTTTTSAAPILVADVNIQGAKVANQVGRVTNISFALSNGQGVQSNVMYAVRLLRDTSTIVADQQVFAEQMTLSEQSVVRKNIVYTAPAGLEGVYDVYVVASNRDGFPFSTAYAGKVTLAKAEGIAVIPGSCVAEKQTSLRCDVINNSTGALGGIATMRLFKGSLFGEKVAIETTAAIPVTLAAKEKKTLTFALPRDLTAGPYVATAVVSAGSSESNVSPVAFSIQGGYGNIVNISLSQDYFTRKESAEVTVTFSGSTVAAIDAAISSHGVLCGSTTIVRPTNVQIISIPTRGTCTDPVVLVTLKDLKGITLDSKEVSIETTSTQGAALQKKQLLSIAIVLIVVLALAFFLRKKKSIPIAPLATLLFAAIVLLPTVRANAATYYAGTSNQLLVTINIDNPQNPGVLVFNQGDAVTVTGGIQNMTATTQTVSLSAITIGNNSVNLFPSPMFPNPMVLSPFGSQAGFPAGFTVNVPTTPALPQSFNVTFTAGIEDSSAPVYVVISPEVVATPTMNACTYTNASGGQSPGTYPDGPVVTAYKADFYNSIADYNSGIKYDVTGKNLKLNLHYYGYHNAGGVCSGYGCGVPDPWTTAYTGILAGQTAYIYGNPGTGTGLHTELYIPGQYVPEDCENYWSGVGEFYALDGSGEAVPYIIIPQPPTVSLGQQGGMYTGDAFSISWGSTNASSCTGTNFSTGGATSGLWNGTISGDVTYTVTCTNVVGSAQDSITVIDYGPRPEGCKPGEVCETQ